MEDLFVVNLHNNDCFTVCKPGEEDAAIKRAREFYEKDADTYRSHLVNYPEMAKEWQRQLEYCEKVLAAGFEAIDWEEYKKRERKRWLSTEAIEITPDRYEEMLGVLPPVNWIRGDGYQMFHISEATSGPYHAQFLRNLKTGKCYEATTDIYDKNTWIDKLLGLVA